MRLERTADDQDPEPETVLRFLADADCRRILGHLDEPKTAQELVEECDIPTSTVYRKLDELTEAGILDESTVVDLHGTNATHYYADWSAVTVTLDADGTLSVSAPDDETELALVAR